MSHPSPTPRDVASETPPRATPAPGGRGTDIQPTLPQPPVDMVRPSGDHEVMPGYRLIRPLGRGGFGEVWESTAPGDYRVALKFLRVDQQAGQIEIKHLQHLKTIRHAHLLPVFGAWELPGYLALAMELADGTLADHVKKCRADGLPGIPEATLFGLMRDAARGIDYLNEKGIVHRDVKPPNLLLVGGTAKVADFGLARLIDQSMAANSSGFTMAYAAPELFNNRLSRSVDQYALAVSYCELRGGRLPFDGTPHEIMFGHAAGTPDLSALPEREAAVVARALAKTPSQRWASCTEFVQAVASAGLGARPAEGPPVTPTRATTPDPFISTNPPRPAPAPTPVTTAPPEGTRRSRRRWLVAAPLAVAAGVAFALFLRHPPTSPSTPNTPPERQIVVKADPQPPADNPKPPHPKPAPPAPVLRLKPIEPIVLTAGESKQFTIGIERENWAGDIKVALAGTPRGVDIAHAADVAAGQGDITATLKTTADALPGTSRLIVTATAGLAHAEQEFRLTIRSAVMPKLIVKAPENVDLNTGQTTNVQIAIDREHWTGDVKLEWLDLPAGVLGLAVPVAADADQAVMVLSADWSASGTAKARLRAAGAGIADAEAAINFRIARSEPPILDSTAAAVDSEKVKKIQRNWAAWLGKPVTETIDLGGGVKMDFVLVPPGQFLMGSPADDPDADAHDKPRHKVRITKLFYLGRTAVTKGQFAAFVAAVNYKTTAETDSSGGYGYNAAENKIESGKQYNWKNTGWTQSDEDPVVNVAHMDAENFCDWRGGRKAGWRPQLPSEAQWEYACRAGTTTRYFTGDDPAGLDGYANVADSSLKAKGISGFEKWTYLNFNDGYAFTSPVGRFKANPLGLYDMTGNVWQWCLDGKRTYQVVVETDPVGTTDGGSDRVYRGGGWYAFPRDCRSADRYARDPSYRDNDLGFRLALVPSGQ